MKRTKLLSLTLTAALLITSLAGCGSKAPAGTETPPPAPETDAAASASETAMPEEMAEDEEPIHIEWLAYDSYGQPDLTSEQIQYYNEKFNVDLDFWYIDSENWDEVLGVKLATGDMPDVMRIRTSANIPNYVKQGILTEFTDDMLAQIPSYMANLKKYDPDDVGLTDGYYNGKLYMLKTISVNGSYPTVLTWRTDWLKNVGIDKIPSTIEEFEKAMYAFKNDDPDGNGKNDTFGFSNTVINAVFGAYGAIPMKEFRGNGSQSLFYTKVDDNIEFACVQPEMKEALATLQKWYKDGLIDPEFVTGENKGGYWATSQDFENGKVGVTGMALSTHWNPPLAEGAAGGACYESFIALNPDTKWEETIDIGPAITGPEGKSGTHCWGAFGTEGWGITTKGAEDPKKVEKILQICEAVAGDFDFWKRMSYGVEGEHFTVDESGSLIVKEPYNETTEAAKAGLGVLKLGANPDFVKESNPLVYDFMDKYRSTGYSDILGPQTEASAMYLEDLKTITLDTYIKIITGEQSVDSFDDFVTKFNEQGGQAIVDEVNSMLK